MGCGGSKDNDDEKKPSKSKPEYKLLLLGTGNSGKSTFFKQLTQLHGGGFMEDEYTQGVKHIHDSILAQMKNLLTSCVDEMGVELDSKLQESANIIQDLSPHASIEDVKEDLTKLWNDSNIKKAFDERTNLGIADSAAYFFDNIERIASTTYRPTDNDILLARIPTTGMRKKAFELNKNIFNIYDVGGQRAERSKWIHSFQVVHGILFVASLSCYDQTLYEDNKLNAMHESLNLFSEIVNSRYFKLTTIMLFLNKNDLFVDKIKKKSIKIAFKDYKGKDGDYKEALDYIKFMYKSQAKKPTAKLYIHVTQATDKNNVEKVFDDVQHSIVMQALEDNGLLSLN